MEELQAESQHEIKAKSKQINSHLTNKKSHIAETEELPRLIRYPNGVSMPLPYAQWIVRSNAEQYPNTQARLRNE
jgi:hypothetical protein